MNKHQKKKTNNKKLDRLLEKSDNIIDNLSNEGGAEINKTTQDYIDRYRMDAKYGTS